MVKYKISKSNADDILELIDDLDKLLTERVADLHEVKGLTQARHAYVFYRNLLWSAKYKFKDSLEAIKSKKG